MTMGVDQTRQENAPAEIQDFIVVRGKLRKFPYLIYAIASDPHRAVFNRRAVHRDDTARANDHFPAVAAVYDGRKHRERSRKEHGPVRQAGVARLSLFGCAFMPL